uniref:EGF-like domain-containing protein n=1 Tax=Gopherus agassizii TaxID=38772 RepID=A0A452HDB8_9SAUR
RQPANHCLMQPWLRAVLALAVEVCSSQCIDPWEICDLHKDCEDGSDEANCPQNHSHCPEGMIQCDEGKCILESLMCNKAEDCLDGTDELSTCGKNCSLNNGSCMEKCTDTNWGVRCSCGVGWELQADGQNCTDVDECSLVYSPCSQLCKNTLGSFTCDCVRGYQLHSGTVCEVSSAGISIHLCALSCNLPHRYMYWVNRGEKGRTMIEAAGMDGSDRQVLAVVPMEEPLGLTLDSITGRLYWISEYKEVQRVL